MKEKYEDMMCDVIEFETADVITDSGNSGNSGNGEVDFGGN